MKPTPSIGVVITASKKKNTEKFVKYQFMTDAICDFLSFIKVGYRRKCPKKEKPLEKLSVVSEANQKQLADFIQWLNDNNDYSPHTVQLYYFSMKKYFEYANEVNMENCRRYIRTLEEQKFSPQTIRLRITALERYSKWRKNPVVLKRPKLKRKLEVENVPTEEEYNRLLEFLSKKANKDYYFFVKVLGTTGARLSEFLQFTWEDIAHGEVVLRGKGNKYRRFFFQKKIQTEVKEYMKTNCKSGLFAMSRQGPMSQRALSQNLKAWGDKCGIDRKKMHPHAFRHFFVKMFLKKSKDVVQLADLLGHGSIDITRIYLQKTYDEQKRDFNKNITW